ERGADAELFQRQSDLLVRRANRAPQYARDPASRRCHRYGNSRGLWRGTRKVPAAGRSCQDLGAGHRRVAQRVHGMKAAALRGVLLALPLLIRQAARKRDKVRDLLKQGNCIIQLRLKDSSVSRHLTFGQGDVRAAWGVHAAPDAEMVFGSVDTAL